jgi:predicted secreted protein
VTKPLARILLICSALFASGAPLAAATSAATTSTPVYTQKDSGRTVHPSQGSKFKIRLKTCADCGDSWSFTKRFDKNVVKLVRTTKSSSATPPAVGGVETITWLYKVVGPGSATVKMAQRSASQSNKVIKRFTLTVQVTPLPRSG